MALAITACVVAWGYLVVSAIDFGSQARGGQSQAWAFLGVASTGAVACLFVGMMLVARVLRRLGITRAPEPREARTPRRPVPPEADPNPAPSTVRPAAPELEHHARPSGGRRAAR